MTEYFEPAKSIPGRSAGSRMGKYLGSNPKLLPWMRQPYPHLGRGLFTDLYQGTVSTTNGPPNDLQVLQAAFSLTDGGDTGQLRGAGLYSLAILQYNTIAQVVWYDIADWNNYADANGYNREDAFFHAASPYNYSTGWGAQGMPVWYWWDAQQVKNGAGIINLFAGTLAGTPTYLTDGVAANNVTFGNTIGDAIYLGYPDRFDEINFVGAAYAAASWAAIVEYPTAVNADYTVATWSTLTMISDTTSGFTTDGRLHWNPYPASDWKKCVMSTTGGGMLTSPNRGQNPGINLSSSNAAQPGYYVRIKTTHAGTPPKISYLKAADYVQSGTSGLTATGLPTGTMTGVIPFFGTGSGTSGGVAGVYLSDAEWGSRSYAAGDARFYYQSRLMATYGMGVPWWRMTQAGPKAWSGAHVRGVLAQAPEADGVFMDNSNGSALWLTGTAVENSDALNYDVAQAALLTTIQASLPAGRNGTRFIMPNTGGDPRQNTTQSTGFAFAEGSLQDNHSWKTVDSRITKFAATASWSSQQANTPPLILIDSYSTYGHLLSRYQLHLLAYYYIVFGTNCMFGPLSGNGDASDANKARSDLVPNRWFAAITRDVGFPLAAASVIATGTDPADGAKTYKLYQRKFQKAVVYFKPLSTDNGNPENAGTNGDSTATTHQLGALYYSLNSDGTFAKSGVTSVSLRNVESSILFLQT